MISAASFREMALSYLACLQNEICFTLGKFGSGPFSQIISYSSFLGGSPT